ncbi:L-threonylcarbamoyladenylate synthase [Crocinitomicaceae bacterium]|jgi:tRNA threonylcarbamoyl adenosine modification protein (Sua5/YciO/YrdC/YwlC family)|nr:L-threonylcarbamoyladenylate synthase [Crocinitomicaceae bacterium]
MLVEINENNIDKRLIKQAVDILKSGGILILPTDTVYAMGCDLHNKKALNQLAAMKGTRLNKVNFSILCHDLSHVSDYVKPIDRSTFKLLKQNTPGPFTFILQANNDVPKLFDTKKKEIGVRIPNNKTVLTIIEELGHPIATTSLHDTEDTLLDYFTDPYAIYERFMDSNDIEMIIDGGNGRLETSTIVDCTGAEFEIIRQGAGQIDI